MIRINICCLVIAVMLAGNQSATAQDQSLMDLLQKMPTGANAVLVADLAKIGQSEVAKKNGWLSSSNGAMESGFGFLPRNATQVAMASRMDYQTFAATWTSGIISLPNMPPLDTVAKVTNGHVDSLAGQQIVVTGSDLIVFPVGKDLGSFTPASRQELAPWLNALKQDKAAGVSDFLSSAVQNRDAATMLVAMDMNYVVSKSRVLQRAKDSSMLSTSGIDADKFATAVSSLKGVTIGVSFIDAAYGNLSISFGENIEFLKPVAKQLVLEVLKQHGAQIAEVSNWNAEVNGTQINFSGKLSSKGLRRVLSLFETPEPHVATSDTNTQPSGADSTKTYFDAVSSFLDELQKEIGAGGQNSYQVSRWFRSYANKIDNLSMNGVDASVLNFGAKVSQTFRTIANSATSTRDSVQVKNSDLMAYGNGSPAYRYRRAGYGYGPYRYGYGYVTPWNWGYGYGPGYGWGVGGNRVADGRNANNQQVNAEKQNIQLRARTGAAESAQQAMTEIVEARQALLRQLTERYPNKF